MTAAEFRERLTAIMLGADDATDVERAFRARFAAHMLEGIDEFVEACADEPLRPGQDTDAFRQMRAFMREQMERRCGDAARAVFEGNLAAWREHQAGADEATVDALFSAGCEAAERVFRQPWPRWPGSEHR